MPTVSAGVSARQTATTTQLNFLNSCLLFDYGRCNGGHHLAHYHAFTWGMEMAHHIVETWPKRNQVLLAKIGNGSVIQPILSLTNEWYRCWSRNLTVWCNINILAPYLHLPLVERPWRKKKYIKIIIVVKKMKTSTTQTPSPPPPPLKK